MTVKQAVPSNGFDVNGNLQRSQYQAFKAIGMDFVVRYVPRTPALISGNITESEVQAILKAGLSLLLVQHCPQPNWHPQQALGSQYGEYAALYTSTVAKVPKGVSLFLDLEGVAPGTPAQDVIDYCEAWGDAVHAQGYNEGVYVGYGCGLSPKQLYENLSFELYWKAYNYDDGVQERSFCIKQFTQKTLSGIVYDPDTITPDNFGGLPMWLSPE